MIAEVPELRAAIACAACGEQIVGAVDDVRPLLAPHEATHTQDDYDHPVLPVRRGWHTHSMGRRWEPICRYATKDACNKAISAWKQERKVEAEALEAERKARREREREAVYADWEAKNARRIAEMLKPTEPEEPERACYTMDCILWIEHRGDCVTREEALS